MRLVSFFGLIFLTMMTNPMSAQAGVIDFEGLGDGVVVAPLSAGDINVTFTCGTLPGEASCYSFQYGGPPYHGFAPNDMPAEGFGEGTSLGFGGLTNQPNGPMTPTDFFFEFDAPITSFGFDAIDVDGNGNTHVLSLFANADFTDVVGTFTYTVPVTRIDGDTTAFSVILTGVTALSAHFSAAADPGLALDNVRITAATAVPEPGTLGMLVFGMFGLAGLMRRRKTVCP